jgi:hypothetical protein
MFESMMFFICAESLNPESPIVVLNISFVLSSIPKTINASSPP